MVVAFVEEHSPAEPEDLGSGFAVSQAFSSTSSLKKSLSRLAQSVCLLDPRQITRGKCPLEPVSFVVE